jgi:murein DD-endopeptidase MepM/ murein hydrolase activator NlpD
VDVVAADRHPSEPVTPYVGKRAARRYAPEAAPATPYVGRRRAAAPTEPAGPAERNEPALPAEQPAYVGRRAARPAEPVAAASAPDAPSAPAGASVALLDVPAPRRSTEGAGQLPFALTEAFTGSLPRIEPLPGTDLSRDTTTALPAVLVGKRRGGRVTPRRTRLRVLPSLPALVGVAALAVAGVGAVSSGKAGLVRADAGPLHQAGALTGTSAVASVGTTGRGTSVSRSSSRAGSAGSAAEQTAAARGRALDQLAAQADDQSALLKKNQWQLPVSPAAYHLTARFGEYGLWANMHTGLDFAAPTGTPIHAVSNGVITSAQLEGAYGNRTVETLEDGTEIWYCHQVQFNVTPGQRVRAGDVIGYVGSTGHVTGPHLHLEVRPGGGDPVDPYPALTEHGLQP